MSDNVGRRYELVIALAAGLLIGMFVTLTMIAVTVTSTTVTSTAIQKPPIGAWPCVLVPRELVGNNTNPPIGNNTMNVIRNGTGFIYLACGARSYYPTPTMIWNNSMGISKVVCSGYYCYLLIRQ